MATNMVYEDGDELSVVCTNPTTPASGGPVRVGYRCGVALTAESEGGNASGYTTVKFDGVFDLSVKAVDDNGNSAVAIGDPLYYVDADTPKISKKASGYAFGYALEAIDSGSTATIQVVVGGTHVGTTPGDGTVATAKLADLAVEPAKLSANLALGYIPLDIGSLRIIASNVIGNTSEGMLLDGNTAPSFQRVNSATDKALRVIWASSSSVEVQFPPVPKPHDLDDAAAVVVHLMMGKDTNTDNALTVAVSFWDGVGDSNAGGATGALDTATLAEYTVSIAHGDIGAEPGFFNIGLTPGSHTSDALWLYAAWVTYSRKA